VTPDLRHAIEAVRHDGGSRRVHCPAHEDRHASLSVGRGEIGQVLLHCHAGCATPDVLIAAGLTMADLYARVDGDREQIVATYDYTDERGTLLYQVCRLSPKGFRQRRPDGAGAWIWNVERTRRVLFGLPQLRGQTLAYIVEGEKDVLALRRIELPATTNAGGAGKWREDYTDQLRAAGVSPPSFCPTMTSPAALTRSPLHGPVMRLD
jgi:putative DNA primase/helicase